MFVIVVTFSSHRKIRRSRVLAVLAVRRCPLPSSTQLAPQAASSKFPRTADPVSKCKEERPKEKASALKVSCRRSYKNCESMLEKDLFTGTLRQHT